MLLMTWCSYPMPSFDCCTVFVLYSANASNSNDKYMFCMAHWVIFQAFVAKKNSQKFFQEHLECQMFWIQIRFHIVLVLIWVQTFCKGYQQTALVGKELILMLALCCHVFSLFSDETDYAFYSTNSTDNGDKTKAGKEAINPHIEIRKYANNLISILSLRQKRSFAYMIWVWLL